MRTAIVWLRRDLRLTDNPALAAATREYEHVLPVFNWSPEEEDPWSPGAAQRWWLHQSLERLSEGLEAAGSRLILRRGPSIEVLRSLVTETAAEAVLWNRLYEPQAVSRDATVENALRDDGIVSESYNGSLLFEPCQIETGQGRPFRVFTPFWKTCLGKPPPRPPVPAPDQMRPLEQWPDSLPLDALELLPRIPWYEGLEESWRPGESGAAAQLAEFVGEAVADYAGRRDYPGLEGVSRMSPHLHFGEISPRSIWAAVASRSAGGGERGAEAYLRELGWREFAHHVLYHFPDTTKKPMNDRFSGFPWREGKGANLAAWQQGRTGIPIVDAGMRQLWRTGWMHNRVRMVVASLLVKNLMWSWRDGAAWFWDTLVDADLANNTMGWQWTAGCGADAAPYFRIFNPVLQGEKFDPDGGYVRRFVPELAAVPPRFLHKPWEMPESERAKIGFRLGRDYPEPIVDLASSRKRALDAFRSVRLETES
jgi:deoxyribodipyrimidine photo-lyase